MTYQLLLIPIALALVIAAIGGQSGASLAQERLLIQDDREVVRRTTETRELVIGPGDIADCGVIFTSGSYTLVANLPGPGGYLTTADHPEADNGDCILILVDDVEINLNGRIITGDSDSDAGNDGDGVRAVNLGGNRENLVVRNGTITEFWRGVNFEGSFLSVVEDVTATNNLSHGITIHSGQNNRVVGNNSLNNGITGIRISLNSLVENNIATGNGGDGIFADAQSVMRGNLASNNDADGISVTCPVTLDGNTATNNALFGIPLDYDLKLQGNAADCTLGTNVFGTISP